MLKDIKLTILHYTLVINFILGFSVIYDIFFIRQFFGLIYLIYIPGFLFLYNINMDHIDGVYFTVLSIGISISFLVLLGLFLNIFLPVVGIFNPLDLNYIFFILFFLNLLMSYILHIRKKKVILKTLFDEVPYYGAIILLLPIISIFGNFWKLSRGDNFFHYIFLSFILIIFITISLYNNDKIKKLYPLVIFIFSISLLLHTSLTSNYLWSNDSPKEYYIYKTVADASYWNPNINYESLDINRLNSMLSITILPVIISSIINIDIIWIFKIVYPLVFSFVPITLYLIWKKYFGDKQSFIASFFFMATSSYYTELTGLGRQMIGELFYALIVLILVSDDLNDSVKNILYLFFSFNLVVSHYALAEILFFYIIIVYIYININKKISLELNTYYVVVFILMILSWYIFTSNSAVFTSFNEKAFNLIYQLKDFFNLESRGNEVLRGVGLETAPSIWNIFGRFFAYLTEGLILLGFISVLTKKSNAIFNRSYFAFSNISLMFLASLILIPGLAESFKLSRFYHILLFFLSPFCIVGLDFLSNSLNKNKLYAIFLCLLVLVPYFAFQSGFVYEVTENQNWAAPLSKQRMDKQILMRNLGYINDYKYSSAFWLRSYVYTDSIPLYADISSLELGYLEIISYNRLYNYTLPPQNSIIYLSYLFVTEGIIDSESSLNSSDLMFLPDSNKIFSNGGGEVYYKMK